MAIYISRQEAGDIEHLSSAVLDYCITEHQRQVGRLQKLKDYYLGRNAVKVADETSDASQVVVVNYPHYITDTVLGFYLGEPVKYDADTASGRGLVSGVEATVRNGRVVVDNKWSSPEESVQPLLDAYKTQTIADVDQEIGKDISIYGEAYELIYASSDAVPQPKSTVCDPRSSCMVRDDTVEHKRLFFMRYEKCKHIGGSAYYKIYVYTDRTCVTYVTDSLHVTSAVEVPDSRVEHFFGQVPAVEYQNNSDRTGDFEMALSQVDAYNTVTSDRVTDKNKFVDSILALYGADITDAQYEQMRKHKMLSGMDVDARLEYVQKAMDENGVQVLCDSLARDIHKITMTVDMTDEKFAGNASGQALQLKLLTMSMLARNKIRSMERGLRKRFEIYNAFLARLGVMPYVDKNAIEPIFTVSMPIDRAEIVDMVSKLQGVVDDETLLNQLWFVRDAKAIVDKVRVQKAEAKKSYMDAFGIKARREENLVMNEDDEDEEV